MDRYEVIIIGTGAGGGTGPRPGRDREALSCWSVAVTSDAVVDGNTSLQGRGER